MNNHCPLPTRARTATSPFSLGPERIVPPPPTCPRPPIETSRPRHLRDLLEWLDELVGNGGPEPEHYDRLSACLRELARQRHQLPHGPQVIQEARATLSPVLLKGTLLGFLYLRPHGYLGDFELLERVLSYHHSTDPNLVRWDAYCHTLPLARALRSRAAHLRTLLERYERSDEPGPRRVLHFRSGPGREFADYFIARGPESTLRADCVDPDPAAVLHGRRNVARMTDRVTFHQAPLLRFRPSAPYRFIWLSSLCEMATDRELTLVLRRLFRWLEPGGTLAICQIARPDATASVLDLLADCRLQYRDARTLEGIAINAGAEPGTVRVTEDPAHANVYLHLQRPLSTVRYRIRRRRSDRDSSSANRGRRPRRESLPFSPGKPAHLPFLPPVDLPTAA